MQTLQKRTSLLLVTLLLATGCGTRDTNASLTPLHSPNSSLDSAINVDTSQFFPWRVSSENGVNIYDESGNLVMVSSANIFVTLEQEGNVIDGKTYQKLSYNTLELSQNTNYYIDCSQEGLVENTSWINYSTNLQPLGLTVVTNDSFTLYDINANEIFKGVSSLTFDVITQQEEGVGVYFQDKLVYLSTNDIAAINGEKVSWQNPESVSVLMYHFFYDPETENSQDGNDLNINTFDQQCDYLQNEGYVTLTMQQLYHYLTGSGNIPSKSVVLTIDDGDESVYRLAKDVIKSHNFNATLFVVGGWFGETLPFEFIELAQDGIELQSHSFLMHQGGCEGMGHGGRLLCVDRNEGIEDTILSLDYVDNGFVYCYPFGDVNDHAIDILQQTNVKMAFTTESGKVRVGDDLFHLPRIRVSENSDMTYFAQSISN